MTHTKPDLPLTQARNRSDPQEIWPRAQGGHASLDGGRGAKSAAPPEKRPGKGATCGSVRACVCAYVCVCVRACVRL